MTIKLWIPVELIEYDEFAAQGAVNVWNNLVVGNEGDSDRLNKLDRRGYKASGQVQKVNNIDCEVYARDPRDRTTERNAAIPVKWAMDLATPGTTQGDIEGWEAAWRINDDNYDDPVPVGITGANGTLTWREWRATNQAHYMDAPTEDGAAFIYVPTYSFDGPVKATEIQLGTTATGVNAWPIRWVRQNASENPPDQQLYVVPLT